MKQPKRLTRAEKIAAGKEKRPFKPAKVADGALQAQLVQAGLTVVGKPLAELGLENNIVLLKDGTKTKLSGFVCLPGQSIEDAIRAALPEGATLYVEPTVEQKPQGRPQRDFIGKKESNK